MRNKKNILITGVGGDIGQGIIKCLKETKYAICFFGCDIDKYAAGSKLVDKFFLAPKTSQEVKYDKFIRNLVARHKINYIFPSTEVEINFFDKKRNYYRSIGVTVFINSSFLVKTFFDKYLTISFLEKIGLPYPRTFLLNEYGGQLDYPLIIKPRFGCSSREVLKINNDEELYFYKKRINKAIVQEYLEPDDEEYTVGIFSDGQKTYSIAFKRKLGFEGISKVVKLSINKEIERIAEKISFASRLTGCINVQMRKTKRGFVIFEINPRISSTVYFRNCFGFRDVKWWLDLADNKKANFRFKYKDGIGVRTLNEIFFDLKPV
jgi:carbamoyl-phosphate synthase large subunit